MGYVALTVFIVFYSIIMFGAGYYFRFWEEVKRGK